MKATKLFTQFFESEKSGGILLLLCTLFSILATNIFIGEDFLSFWHLKIGSFSLEYIINDGLMTIFFLLIGLELEREIYIGELSSIKNALLPVIAALGGMLFPAFLYFVCTRDSSFQDGIGIPMATDIAFAIGILSLLGKKVPTSLKVFLTALAVIDDLGAIVIIAVFYSKTIDWFYLGMGSVIFAVLLVLNRLKVYRLTPYLLLGILMWYCLLYSGVHATISGVLVAFAIPFQKGEPQSISYRLQHFLHLPVSYFILPLFALANTAILLHGKTLFENSIPIYAIGIITGLVIGKPLGIFLFSYLATKLRWTQLPEDLSWKAILGAGMLGGIGFTMSIFITLLAFSDAEVINQSKLFIIIGSLLSGILGLLFLKKIFKKNALE